MSSLRIKALLFGATVGIGGLLATWLLSVLTQGVTVSSALLPVGVTSIVSALAFAAFFRQTGTRDRLEEPPGSDQIADQADSQELDLLTRLLNRRGLTVKLLELMALVERYGNELAVAVIGIDHLADVQQKYGDEASDKALVAISMELSDTLRMPDRLGRWSDDQFVVILPETSLPGARNIAERLREAVARAQFEASRGVVLTLTASIGVTSFRLGDDLESLLSRAGRAADAAKSQGTNRVSTHLAA